MTFFRAFCAGGFAFHHYHDYNKERFSRMCIEQTLTAQDGPRWQLERKKQQVGHMTQLLMPKATAVWLIDNTALSFDQIGTFATYTLSRFRPSPMVNQGLGSRAMTLFKMAN